MLLQPELIWDLGTDVQAYDAQLADVQHSQLQMVIL